METKVYSILPRYQDISIIRCSLVSFPGHPFDTPCATLLICLYSLKHGPEIHGFTPTWNCLFVTVLVNRLKFLQPPGYFPVINRAFTFWTTTNVLWFHPRCYTYLALAGPSGIRAGWGIEINGKFEVESPPASAGPPLSPLYSTGHCFPV